MPIDLDNDMLTLKAVKQHIREPYAWPGGYPKYFITADGEPLSIESARKNWRTIIEAHRHTWSNDWRIVACEINWEDPELYCADTGERIQSAYAEDD